MFGLSFGELIIIVGVILMVFGPEKLPEIARMIGKFSNEAKKTSSALRKEFYNSVYEPAKEIENQTKNLIASSPLDEIKKEISKIVE